MNGRCNRLSLDEVGLMQKLTEAAEIALGAEAEDLRRIMQQKALRTVHGAGPGKPEWREDISKGIEIVAQKQGLMLGCAVGYLPKGVPETVRA